MDTFLAASQRIQTVIGAVLGFVSASLLLGITLFALLEIVRRYIFNVVFEWGQDAIVVGMVSAVALFFCVTQTRRSHLVMNAIVHLLHDKGFRKLVGFIKILVSAIIAVFCGAIAITGQSTLDYAIARELVTYSLIIPLWPFYLIMMIGFGLTSFVAFLQMIEDIIGFVRGDYMDAEFELMTDV